MGNENGNTPVCFEAILNRVPQWINFGVRNKSSCSAGSKKWLYEWKAGHFGGAKAFFGVDIIVLL